MQIESGVLSPNQGGTAVNSVPCFQGAFLLFFEKEKQGKRKDYFGFSFLIEKKVPQQIDIVQLLNYKLTKFNKFRINYQFILFLCF